MSTDLLSKVLKSHESFDLMPLPHNQTVPPPIYIYTIHEIVIESTWYMYEGRKDKGS